MPFGKSKRKNARGVIPIGCLLGASTGLLTARQGVAYVFLCLCASVVNAQFSVLIDTKLALKAPPISCTITKGADLSFGSRENKKDSHTLDPTASDVSQTGTLGSATVTANHASTIMVAIAEDTKWEYDDGTETYRLKYTRDWAQSSQVSSGFVKINASSFTLMNITTPTAIRYFRVGGTIKVGKPKNNPHGEYSGDIKLTVACS